MNVTEPVPAENAEVPLLLIQSLPTDIVKKLAEVLKVPWEISKFPLIVVLAESVTVVGLSMVRLAGVFAVSPVPVTCADVPL